MSLSDLSDELAQVRTKEFFLRRWSRSFHFGYKAHIGADKDSGLVHDLKVITANVHTETAAVLALKSVGALWCRMAKGGKSNIRSPVVHLSSES
jgi:cation transport regulator ChaC